MSSPRLLTATLLALSLVCCSSTGDTSGVGESGISGHGDASFTPGTDGGTTEDAPLPHTADATTTEDTSSTGVEPEPCDDCFHPATCVDGHCVNPEPGGCTPGETDGCYGIDEVMTCDESGTFFVPISCPSGEICEVDACEMLLFCEPDSWTCQGVGMKKQCASDGSGFGEPIPCPEGDYCDDGKCGSSCAPDPKFGATVGCAFWTVDLPNYPDPTLFPTPEDLPHAVVVSNPGELDTEVSFEAPTGVTVDVDDPVVPAGQSRVFFMPSLNVSDSGITPDGILMTATRPVLVHQFNPWDNTASNDASLLIPEPFLGKKYVVLSWPTTPLELLPFGAMQNQAGYFTVVATEDSTKVTIQVTANTKAGPGLIAMSPGNIQTVTLDRGEVLNVEAEPTSLFDLADLTGSTISATKPVAAFGGHEEAVVSSDEPSNPNRAGPDQQACCADHLEEQLLPLEMLDADYVAVKTKPRGGEPDVWRVQAAEANVTVTTTPVISGLNGVTLVNKGDWVEAESKISFEVHGTGPLQVGQYLVSQSETDAVTGDPSLILAIPAARYRDAYVLMVPDDYTANWITVVKAPSTTVQVGSTVIDQADFTSIGGGTWESGYVSLSPGVHEVTGDAAFGVVAYGFNSAVSYGYPGGMSAPSSE